MSYSQPPRNSTCNGLRDIGSRRTPCCAELPSAAPHICFYTHLVRRIFDIPSLQAFDRDWDLGVLSYALQDRIDDDRSRDKEPMGTRLNEGGSTVGVDTALDCV